MLQSGFPAQKQGCWGCWDCIGGVGKGDSPHLLGSLFQPEQAVSPSEQQVSSETALPPDGRLRAGHLVLRMCEAPAHSRGHPAHVPSEESMLLTQRFLCFGDTWSPSHGHAIFALGGYSRKSIQTEHAVPSLLLSACSPALPTCLMICKEGLFCVGGTCSRSVLEKELMLLV